MSKFLDDAWSPIKNYFFFAPIRIHLITWNDLKDYESISLVNFGGYNRFDWDKKLVVKNGPLLDQYLFSKIVTLIGWRTQNSGREL